MGKHYYHSLIFVGKTPKVTPLSENLFLPENIITNISNLLVNYVMLQFKTKN
jgi:hypothetical protein